MASRWQPVGDLIGSGFEPHISHKTIFVQVLHILPNLVLLGNSQIFWNTSTISANFAPPK